MEEGFLLLLPPPPCNTSTKTSRRSCRVCQSKNWSRSLERAEPMETESLRQTLLGDSCPDQPVHRSQLCKQLALLRDLAVRALAAASRLLELGHLPSKAADIRGAGGAKSGALNRPIQQLFTSKGRTQTVWKRLLQAVWVKQPPRTLQCKLCHQVLPMDQCPLWQDVPAPVGKPVHLPTTKIQSLSCPSGQAVQIGKRDKRPKGQAH